MGRFLFSGISATGFANCIGKPIVFSGALIYEAPRLADKRAAPFNGFIVYLPPPNGQKGTSLQ